MKSPTRSVLVAGGGGFIGGHLARRLISLGHKVRCVDSKPLAQWHQLHSGAQNVQGDLASLDCARSATFGVDQVYNLAADMGGIGFIENNKALCMLSVLINTHLLQASRENGVERYFFASSACVYAADKQVNCDARALAESDAYPAQPEDGYGWEKLFSERMCRHFREDYGLETRVGRFHNIYGPHGTYDGGREKAPAAVCRKVIEAQQLAAAGGTPSIEIWGTGEQTRSFTYVDDCIDGIELLQNGACTDPLNVGSSELVTINELVSVVEELAGLKLQRIYRPDAPTGVNGRNSDNGNIQRAFGWEPSTPLRIGMARTYAWVHAQMTGHLPDFDRVGSPILRRGRRKPHGSESAWRASRS